MLMRGFSWDEHAHAPCLPFFPGGATPIEMTYLSASSTLMSSSITSLRATTTKYPLVGFGVVGTYTLRCSPCRWRATSPPGVPVRKAIVQVPGIGHCTSSALRNAWPLEEKSVSEICFTLE